MAHPSAEAEVEATHIGASTMANSPDASSVSVDDALSAIYSGAKAALRPIHDKVMDDVNRFGQFETVPKQSYVSLRRTKPFAMIGPATDARVEVGLNLEGVDGAGRLLAMPPGSLCSHVVKLTSVADANAELTAWLRAAYDAAA